MNNMENVLKTITSAVRIHHTCIVLLLSISAFIIKKELFRHIFFFTEQGDFYLEIKDQPEATKFNFRGYVVVISWALNTIYLQVRRK